MVFVDLKTASLFCSWKVAIIVPVAAFCLRQAVQLFGMPRNKCSNGGVVHCLVSVYISTVYLDVWPSCLKALMQISLNI